MEFEEFVKDSIDTDEYIVKKCLHAQTTKNMLECVASQRNRTFIYNYEDNKCYYLCDGKLYRLSVGFDEIKI